MDGTPKTDYRLSRFIPLPENRVACHAGRRVLEAGLGDLNGVDDRGLFPLLVYGPAGCGKSHFLRGLAQELIDQQPETRLESLTPEEWAVAASGLAAGHPRIVLIEDLHRFRAHAVHQADFLRLLGERGPVLVSSQCLPQRLTWLGGRVISRLLRGLVISIGRPGAASRARLLLEFAARRQLLLSPAMIEPLAPRLPASIRQLEALVIGLQQTPEGRRRPGEVLSRLLDEHPASDSRRQLERIVRPVAEMFRLHPGDLRGGGREQRLSRPRQLAMYLARQHTGLSLQRIGRFFGRRDHATVLHACRKIERAAVDDPALTGLLRELRSQVAGC